MRDTVDEFAVLRVPDAGIEPHGLGYVKSPLCKNRPGVTATVEILYWGDIVLVKRPAKIDCTIDMAAAIPVALKR